MMKSLFIITFTLLAYGLLSSGYASTSLTIGYQASLAPLSQQNPFLDTVKKTCKAAELDCKFTRYPIKRGAFMLKSGIIDALLTIDDQQFRHCCNSSLWTTPAFYGIYAKQDPIHIPRYEQELIGHSLIIIRGSQTCKISLPNLDRLRKEGLITVYEANDRTSAIRMFQNGRAEYFWGIADIENDLKANNGGNNIQFLPILTRPVAVWFHKSKTSTLIKFDQAFET